MLYESLSDRLFGAPGTWSLRRCPNPKCGMVWLDPMPLEEDICKAYRSYYTHRDDVRSAGNLAERFYSRVRKGYLYSKYGYRDDCHNRWGRVIALLALLAFLDPVRRERLGFNVFYLNSRTDGRLLEVGCGSGTALKSMQELGWQVEGVDFDPAAVEQARRKGLTVHLGKLKELKLPDESFDAITACHVVEHITDPIGMLRECRRLLKPSGVLVLITPNAGSWGHQLFGRDWRGLEPPRHLRLFTPSSLTTMVQRGGFGVRECRTSSRGRGVFLASRRLRRTNGPIDQTAPNVGEQLLAELMEIMEGLRSVFRSWQGEEIILMAAR